jgi:hypothetical protein
MKRSIIVLTVLGLALSLAAPTFAASAPKAAGPIDVIPLGAAVSEGRIVEGFAFVHRAGTAPGLPIAAAAKGGIPGPPDKPSDPGDDPDDGPYAFLGKGVRWRVTEEFVVNPTNADGVTEDAVATALTSGMTAWESAASTDIFGPLHVTTQELVPDETRPDEQNEILFGSWPEPNVIAVTIVWGVFRGRPDAREIYECDMVFNEAWTWGDATVQSGVMDVENIGTHELGHVAGLADLYETTASEQTMYGYGAIDEIKKRTLEAGDIAGVKALYQ